MSKKTAKRKIRKEGGVAVARSPVTVEAIRTAVQTSSSRTTEFKPDYSYVIKDLRRIGILAGSFIAILVVLSFFLQ